MKKYSELVDGGNYKAWHYFEKFKMTLYDEKVLKILLKFIISMTMNYLQSILMCF